MALSESSSSLENLRQSRTQVDDRSKTEILLAPDRIGFTASRVDFVQKLRWPIQV